MRDGNFVSWFRLLLMVIGISIVVAVAVLDFSVSLHGAKNRGLIQRDASVV